MAFGKGYSIYAPDYYYSYYQSNKQRISNYYYEKKARHKRNEEIYKDYDSEEAYYKNKLIEMGFLEIVKK